MTMLLAVSGPGVLVLAADSSGAQRALDTGAPVSAPVPLKLDPLSDRHPIAAGTFGNAGSLDSRDYPGADVASVARRCRQQLGDGDTYTVESVARRYAADLHRSLGPLLAYLEGRQWTDAADLPPGAYNGRTITGALVAGYGSDGVPEAWTLLVTARGPEDVTRRFRGEGKTAMSPGCDAAWAVHREIVGDGPRTLDQAARMAARLVRVQTAAGPGPFGVTVTGPVNVLGMAPGARPVPCVADFGAPAPA